MDSILGEIYCLFETFFGQNLAEYLWGFDGSEYSLSNMYNIIGLITLVVSFVVAFAYYYIINSSRHNKWYHWILTLLINGVIAIFIGYRMTISDYLNGNIADVLRYERDEEGDIVADLITSLDCFGFGMANFFVSVLFFVTISFIIKWGSRNCKNSPC